MSHQSHFEKLWAECADVARGAEMPTILQMDDVDRMRERGLCVGRRKAHDILLAARGLMHEELQTSSDLAFEYTWFSLSGFTALHL